MPNAHESIPLARIGAYLRALVPFSGGDAVPVEKFMASLDDITPRQFTDDCAAWGLTWIGGSLDSSRFARAVRRELYKRRRQDVTVELEPAALPDAKTLIETLGGDEAAARQAPLIETAYDYAVARPRHFLSSHGDVERGCVGYRHQVEEALRIVEEMLGNGLVVHEVGLGKTITGILVLTELLRRDPKLTCLILVPPNLRSQWAKELAAWSLIKVAKEGEEGYAPKRLRNERYLLLTIDSAKEERRARVLRKRHWGLLLVDEGHWLRNDDIARYRFVYSLRARYRLLLTATPVHNSGYDIFNQVNVVRPGHLGRKAVFADNYMRDERQIDHAEDLQERLSVIVNQRQRHETDLRFPRRKIEAIEIAGRSDEESHLYNQVLSLLRGIYRWHLGGANFLRRPSGKEQAVSQLVLIAMLVLRELASHPAAAIKTMAGPLKKTVEKLAKASGAAADLRNLDAKLAVLAKQYGDETWGAGKHRKTDHLIEQLPALAGKYGRVIVYVEFRETQKAIMSRLAQIPKEALRAHGLHRRPVTIVYNGELSQTEKDHNVDRLNDAKHAWFISTDAGGQGLNLQSGRVVVNFDFPWNPMRVEQRIGRVDRIGQRAPNVIVQNYLTIGTIEEYVYRALRQKLNVCEDVLGRVIPQIFQLERVHARYATPEDVLGIGQIILSSENEDDLRAKFRQFGAEIDPDLEAASSIYRPPKRRLDE